MAKAGKGSIGNRIAPIRFILFVLLLLVAVPAAWWLLEDWRTGVMAGFDVSAIAFLVSCLPLLRVSHAGRMREDARRNDANRAVLLGITGVVMIAILAAIAAELTGQTDSPGTKPLIVATLLIAWLFSNSVFALHYAHLAYTPAEAEDKQAAIDFPGDASPVYSDFVYFAFTLGMTFQTSDVTIRDGGIRRVVTFHCLAAFVFNIGVLAFTINVLGG
jgi:uncharacterized membrane protein